MKILRTGSMIALACLLLSSSTFAISLLNTGVHEGNVGEPATAAAGSDYLMQSGHSPLSASRWNGIVLKINEIINWISTTSSNFLTEVSWGDITSKPAGLDDGDDDTKPTTTCTSTQKLTWDGNSFACGTDIDTNTDNYNNLTNKPLTLNATYYTTTDKKIGATEYCDEYGNNCIDISHVSSHGVCKSYRADTEQTPSTTNDGCVHGEYTNETDTETQFVWSCGGSGITEAICTQEKLVASGVCTKYDPSDTQTADGRANYGCDKGKFVDIDWEINSQQQSVREELFFTWICKGINGGDDAYCRQKKSPIDGACESYDDAYEQTPDGRDNYGCTDGIFQDTDWEIKSSRNATEEDFKYFSWICKGQYGGEDKYCKQKKTPTTGICQSFSAKYSQTANGAVAYDNDGIPYVDLDNYGCLSGKYEDLPDLGPVGGPAQTFTRRCEGYDGGGDVICTQNAKINGVCADTGEISTIAAGCAIGEIKDSPYSMGTNTLRRQCEGVNGGSSSTLCEQHTYPVCREFAAANSQTADDTPDSANYGCINGIYNDEEDDTTTIGTIFKRGCKTINTNNATIYKTCSQIHTDLLPEDQGLIDLGG